MEPIEAINKRLKNHYGLFEDGRQNWRVVFSDDQLEMRETAYSKEGLLLSQPIVIEMKKYPFDHGKYILERLIGIPDGAITDLTAKSSYEPVWTFEDRNHNALIPDWDIIYLVVNQVLGQLAAGHSPFPKYHSDDETTEARLAKVEKIYEELYGNETAISDSLKNDTAVGYGERKRNDWTY